MNRFGRIARKWFVAALLLASAFAWAGPADDIFSGAWDWRLPPRKYGKLSQSERVQYSQGETLIREGKYEAAALEFEKFVTAYPRTDAYAHALLLEGYCYHLGKFRNKAIERYNDVLNFYAEEPDAAVPAGFLKGQALIENGNLEGGYAVFQEITDKDANLANPLSDLALSRLADYYLTVNDTKKAERCWKRVVDAFKGAFYGRPEATAVGARQKLIELYCRENRFSSVDELLDQYPLEGKKKSESISYAVERGFAVFDTITVKARKSFLEWVKAKRAEYEADSREVSWYSQALTLCLKADFRADWASLAAEWLAYLKGRSGSDVVAPVAGVMVARFSEANNAGFKVDGEWKLFGETMTAQLNKSDAAGQLKTALAVLNGFSARLVGGSDSEVVWNTMIARCRDLYLKMMNPEKDDGLAGLIDRLRNVRQFDRAMELVARIENQPLAMWKEIEILGAREQFAAQAAKCDELEKLEDKGFSVRALRLRAQLYKDRLAKYEDAVKLYAMINDPPGTIWATSECYERMGKPDSAVNALTEIENFFERDASQAALRKAEIWDRAHDKVKTVAALRAVLKKYPKSQASSQAHQMLERLGVATGGGVIDEE